MSVFTCTAATLKNASFPWGDAIFMAGTVNCSSEELVGNVKTVG
jgi:hypothetical protein